MKIVNARPEICKILEMTGISMLLPNYSDEQDAVRSFEVKNPVKVTKPRWGSNLSNTCERHRQRPIALLYRALCRTFGSVTAQGAEAVPAVITVHRIEGMPAPPDFHNVTHMPFTIRKSAYVCGMPPLQSRQVGFTVWVHVACFHLHCVS